MHVAGLWELRVSYLAGYRLCAFEGSEAKLSEIIFETGVELERATVARTILWSAARAGV